MNSNRSNSIFTSATASTVASATALGMFVCVALIAFAGTVFAQDRPAAEPESKDATAAPAPAESGALNEAEASLGRRYRQFERTLLQMAEYLRKTEPERADLLIRAIGKSKEDRVGLQMDQILDLLKSEQLGDAIGHQEHLVTNLKGLLELLQSEDRRHQLDEEKKWLETVHREIGKLSVRQKEVRRATEKANKLGPLAERQGDIGRDTDSLEKKIDKQDAARNAANRRNPSDKSSRSPDGREKDGREKDGREKKESAEKQNTEKQNPDRPSKPKKGSKEDAGKPQNKEAKQNKQPADGKPGSQNKSGESPKKESQKKDSEKKESKQSKGSPKQPPKQGSEPKSDDTPQESPSEQSESDSSPQQMKKTPGRQEIEQARRAMQQAQEELKRLQGDKALERQDEAIRKLAEAKERLEKILRQLREEEQEIMLTSLEARFAKMLLMQIQLHVDTVTLSKTGKNAWTARHFGKARELSVQQDSIADDAAKALTLLKEEGSSVAFPQGVEQVRDDMLNIARRLGKNDVGERTQLIEKDVIEALEELVSSLQSEIENRKKPESQRQRRGKPGGDQEDNKRLVEQIAELKMLRSLQLRVNRRTKQIGRLIHGEQATSDDLAGELQALARRQAEIQEATYILASGRNQ